MTPPRDIHNYDGRYKAIVKRIRGSSISLRNKEMILNFDNTCLLEGLSKPRRLTLLDKILRLAEHYFRKDLDKATVQDIKDVVTRIENRSEYSVWTKQNYRAIIKKFFKWVEYGDDYKSRMEYPKTVSWINTNVKKKDQPKVQASDLLTEEEIDRLIKNAEHPRDKAFISMLYELGARIGEIGNLEIKDITKDRYSYLVDLRGKTGRRTPRVVISSPYIVNWLNVHSERDNPHSPLWILTGRRDKIRKMQYGSLRALVIRLAQKAKVKKRVYPHLFRHTRVTHLMINKQISEQQAKVYFGWVPSSKMLSEYSHLVSSDVNNAILEMHGIRKVEQSESKLKPKQCSMCETINSNNALFCQRCGNVLDTKVAMCLDKEITGRGEVVNKLLQDPDVQKLLKEKMVEIFAR